MTGKRGNGSTRDNTRQQDGVVTGSRVSVKNVGRAAKRTKKCRVCGKYFVKKTPLQIVCGIKCAIIHAGERRKNQSRQDKIAFNRTSRIWWIKKTQAAVNKWVRDRDAGLPCISCGCPEGRGKRNAGHYRPAGVNSALRFDPRCIHGQCERCNTYLSGNLTAYRVGLIAKIGEQAVRELDDNHEIKAWSIPELESICQAVKLGIFPYTKPPLYRK